MPDLRQRPARYLTAAVLATSLAAAVVPSLDLRLGPDERVAALQQENADLRLATEAAAADRSTTAARERALPVRTTPAVTVSAASTPATARALTSGVRAAAGPLRGSGTTITRPTVATPAAVRPVGTSAAADCARYPTQEAAQAAFNADRRSLATMDGNANGRACEQLRSAVTTAAAIARTVTVPPVQQAQPVRPPVQPARPPVQPVRPPVQPAQPPAQPAGPAAPVAPSLPKTPTKAAILASGMHFGLSTEAAEGIEGIEGSLGRQSTMEGYFKGFDSGFDPDRVVTAWRGGRIPVMTWESRPLRNTEDTTDYSLPRIIDGTFDAYLTSYARSVAELGLPLVIRFDQEMNGNWYRWAEFENPKLSKGDYVRAWRHIHDIFQAEGANASTIWLWSPNRVDNITRFPPMDDYWPGTQYVDQVGMTGYLRQEDRGPRDFEGTYAKTLAELQRVAPGKSVLLSEVGATEAGGKKAGWLAEFFPGMAARPEVAGFLWFDYAVTSNGRTDDWRIRSTTPAFQAFKTGLAEIGYGLELGKDLTLRELQAPARRLPVAPMPASAPATSVAPGPARAGAWDPR